MAADRASGQRDRAAAAVPRGARGGDAADSDRSQVPSGGGPNVAVTVRAGDGAGAAARLIAEAERIVDGRLRALMARSRRSLEIDAIGEQRTVASGRDAPRTRLSACSSRGQESARGRAADSCRVGCKVALRYCADRLPPPAMREA